MHLNKLVYNVYSWIRKLLFRIICYFLYLFVFLFPLNSGLSTEATSNGFYIDETPPSIKVKPQLSRDLVSWFSYKHYIPICSNACSICVWYHPWCIDREILESKDRQQNDQHKKDKKTKYHLQNIHVHIKLKIE
jgi:hypothetical protein